MVDCYVDEPSCLGVPPYISPYPRYAAGALISSGVSEVRYLTIDDFRKGADLSRYDLVVVIGGIAVPGKYLRAAPATPREMEEIARSCDGVKVLGGPIVKFGYGKIGGREISVVDEEMFDVSVGGDLEAFLPQLVRDGIEKADPQARAGRKEILEYAVKGAYVITHHWEYPTLMCEIETYRGCLWRRCSFCTQHVYGEPDFRPPEDVVREIEALYKHGARYFRLGAQPDLFAYCADDRKPNVDAIRRLYEGIRSVAPDLKVLHMDNGNPAFISSHPDECREIAKIIVKYHTPGDVVALGGETADPRVVRMNSLNSDPDDVFEAVKLLNEVGAKRGGNGLPELLPGLNFVCGLIGESKRTYELNFEFLKRILDEGLMVRRINIRQVAPMKGTRMHSVGDKIIRKHRRYFQSFKRRVREEIDSRMLRRVVPPGTVLRDVRMEVYEDGVSFGRQLATYPLLVGVEAKLEMGRFYDIGIFSYGYRSVTGIPVPLNINQAGEKLLSMLPGMGERKVADVLARRPFRDYEEVGKVIGMETLKNIRDYITL